MTELDNNRPICLALDAHTPYDPERVRANEHHPPTNMTPECNGVIVRLTEDRLIVVDLWMCPTCGARIIDRKGQGKMVERWQGEVFDHLERRLQSMGVNVQAGHPERNEVYGYAE